MPPTKPLGLILVSTDGFVLVPVLLWLFDSLTRLKVLNRGVADCMTLES